MPLMPSDQATNATGLLPTPIGTLAIVASARGIVRAQFLDDPAQAMPSTPAAPTDPRAMKHLADATRQLSAYFQGTRTHFSLALDAQGTDFQQRVWAELVRIPYASTTTYGALAKRLGDVNATRAVGLANGKNPIAIIVPCHRVIGADGTLTGYAGGLERKQWLLDHERRIGGTGDDALLFSMLGL